MMGEINDLAGQERNVSVDEIQVKRSQGIIESQREGGIR